MLESNMYCTIVTKMNKLNYLHIIKNNLYRCFSDVPQVYLQYIKKKKNFFSLFLKLQK